MVVYLMLEDHFWEDSLDPLLENYNTLNFERPPRTSCTDTFLDGLLRYLQKFQPSKVQICVLITLSWRFFVCEVETVTAHSSQLRIAAGEKWKAAEWGKWGNTNGRETGRERRGVTKRRMWVTMQKTQEDVWIRQWLCQGVKRSKHHQRSSVVTRSGSGLNTTLGRSIYINQVS